MNKTEIAEILAKPYSQDLLNGPEPARFAYNGLDGDPRVIPIGFWVEDDQIQIATVPKAAKVAALRKHPKVALTIDTGAFPRRSCCSAAPPRSSWSRASPRATWSPAAR